MKSLVNFYAASPLCVIDFINASELLELGKSITPLNERLNSIKFKIDNAMVDDIDYFNFPKQLLQG